MKHTIRILTLLILALTPAIACAQKLGFVDTEYILGKIPAYRSAKEQVETLSSQYQREIQQGYDEIKRMVQSFQSESVLMTAEMRQAKQKEILQAEEKVRTLQQNYFGPEGLIIKKQEELLKPIQEQVYNAVKEVAKSSGYAAIIDVAASASVIYSSPRYDVSDDVLKRMGYK